MSSEMMRILKMIEEGIVTAEEGAELMAALKDASTEEKPFVATESPSQAKANPFENFDRESFLKNDFKASPGEKFLQIRVLSAEGDKVKVNLPINFVRGILKVSGKLPMIQADQLEGINTAEMMETISQAIENDLSGRLIDVESVKGDLVIVEIV